MIGERAGVYGRHIEGLSDTGLASASRYRPARARRLRATAPGLVRYRVPLSQPS